MCQFDRTVIIQDIVLAIVINTSATLLGADPFDHTWYTFTCVALATNVVAQLVVPTDTIARALTGWAGTHPARPYAQIFVENLIFVTIISLTEAFVHTGGAGLLAAWSATYLQLVAIGYVTSVVLFRIFSARPA